MLSLNQQQSLNYIVMRKVPVDGGFFVYLPNTYTLVIGAADHQFIICAYNYVSDPFLMPLISSGIESSTDFPQLNGFVSGTANKVIAVHNKIHVTYVMVVTMECFAAYKVII